MLGEVTLQFDPAVTVDAHRKHLEKAKANPDWEIKAVESVEVLRNHLMVAHLRNGEYHIFSDEPAGEMGGEGWAPSMLHYFFAGALLTECAQYVWNLGEFGLLNSIRKLEMSIQGHFPTAPWLGLAEEGENPALRDVVVTTKIESDASPELIEKLARVAATRCPAHQSLARPIKIKNVVELNGKQIAEFSDV